MGVPLIAGETHHIVLSDGINSIGLMGCDGQGNPTFDGWRRTPMSRSSMKTSTGETKYSDLEPPYYTVAQERWDGGLGQLRFEDKTMFYFSKGMWTWYKDGLLLAPAATHGQTANNLPINWDDDDIHNPSYRARFGEAGEGTITAYAVKFQPSVDVDVTSVKVYGAKVGRPFYGIDCTIVQNNAGLPADPSLSWPDGRSTIREPDVPSDTPGEMVFTWEAGTNNLSAGNTYWIVISTMDRAEAPGNYYVLCGAQSQSASTAYATDETFTWTATSEGYRRFFFQLNDGGSSAGAPIACMCQYYGGTLYAFTAPKDGSAGKMWLNGDIGVPSAATSTTLTDSTKDSIWTADCWAGATVCIIEGKGKGQSRYIASNTSTQLVIDNSTPWDITPDNTSVYLITNTQWWRDITPTSGNTIDKPVTDVVSAGGYLWIGQGSSQPILRYKAFNNSGTWTVQTADITGEYAEFMTVHRQGAAVTIYKAHFDSSSKLWMVRYGSASATPDWHGAAIISDAVTGMTVFQNIVYIMTQPRVYAIQNNTLIRTDITYPTHEWNGIAPTAYNSYLMFPVKSQLARMSGSSIDIVGPDHMPPDRTGHITDMVDCGRWLICAYSGGSKRRSTLLLYNGTGWHVLAASGAVGVEITAVAYQSIPGGPDKVWYAQATQLKYVNVPRDKDVPLEFVYNGEWREGELITSWFDLSMVSVDKYWNELTMFWRDAGSGTSINVYYQTNSETDADGWHYLGAIADDPIDTIDLVQAGTPVCKRIRLKFVFVSSMRDFGGFPLGVFNVYNAPEITAFALEGVARLMPKYSYSHLCLVVDKQKTLDGREEESGAEAILDRLDSWAASATPVLVTTCDPHAPSFHAFVEPVEYRVTRFVADRPADKNEYIIVLNLLEA